VSYLVRYRLCNVRKRYTSNPDRIVNLGDGHAAWDNGLGYTYFNETKGLSFSAVSELTYNFTNPHTDYQNGIGWHTDLEASRFLSKQFFVGAVGCYFNQLTGDTGSGATLGPYLSRIAAIGPEIGVLFPVGEMQGSLNLRGYWEFTALPRSASGTLRHFAAAQQLGRFWREADMKRIYEYAPLSCAGLAPWRAVMRPE